MNMFRYLRRTDTINGRFYCRWTQVPAGEGEGDRLQHLDDHHLLLLVHVGGLRQLDVAGPDVARGGELDALLGAGDHHGLAELGEVPAGGKVAM